MNDKKFLGFIFNRATMWGGFIFGCGIPIYNYIKSNDFYQSLSICLAVVLVLLLLSLYSVFKEFQNIGKLKEKKEEELRELNLKYKNLDLKYNNQTKEYKTNIREINRHKGVTTVVKSIISSDPPKTDDGKRLVNLLKNAVEISFKGK
jgi:hypothetical protein